MINHPCIYEEAGAKAAQARNKGDEALYSHHYLWFRKARGLEKETEDRHAADAAWKKGWESARPATKFLPFR